MAHDLRSVGWAARQLDHLLDDGRLSRPCVLVTSSISCWIADQYAAQWPRDVTGMVLIDPVNLRPWPVARPEVQIRDGAEEPNGYLRAAGDSAFAELARTRPLRPRRSVVVSSADGRWERHAPRSENRWWEPLTLAEVDQFWQSAQREWVDRLHARHVVADTAGHLVHLDQPDLVAHVITAVIDAARAGKALRLDPDAVTAAGGRLASPKP